MVISLFWKEIFMLSYSDFSQKQFVIITAEQVKDLSLRNDNLLIKQDEKIVDQISCFKIFCIFIIGDCTFTSKLITKLFSYQIWIFVLNRSLKPLFSISSPLAGNYLLRSKQYTATNEQDLQIAKYLIINKITNQLALLKEIRNKDDKIKNTIKQLQELEKKIENTDSDDSLRGIEGSASKLFFSNYFKDLKRYKREPRTKSDVINFLMDMWYSFLYNFVEANLNLYGFDIYRGVYHKLFYERKSLVCDLVEPFRSLIDKTLLKAHNLGQIDEKDFSFHKWEYQLSREKREKYLKLFLGTILEYKMEFFDYIKQYYRYVMDPNKPFPIFRISA